MQLDLLPGQENSQKGCFHHSEGTNLALQQVGTELNQERRDSQVDETGRFSNIFIKRCG
jgi:hypothetical protein